MIIGAFEELVLLAVGALGDNAYGVSIKELLEEHTGKRPSIGALHSALYRLEDKGFLTSTTGGVTTERGGRRKKFYQLTSTGKETLLEVNALRQKFSRQISWLNLNFG